MFKPNKEHSQTNIFGFSNFISTAMFKELQESEEANVNAYIHSFVEGSAIKNG